MRRLMAMLSAMCVPRRFYPRNALINSLLLTVMLVVFVAYLVPDISNRFEQALEQDVSAIADMLAAATAQPVESGDQEAVDALLLAEVYAAGESPIVAADGRALVRAVRVAGKVEPLFVKQIADMAEAIRTLAKPGDVVVTMGAGSIGSIAANLAAQGLAGRQERTQ